MIKHILLFSFLIVSGLSFGQGIEFIHEDLEEAKKQAAAEEKIIFVDAYTTWCGPCKRLSKDIFPQKAAGDFYNANFINLKLDMEKGDGLAFGMKYSIKSYPTLLFITADGELVMKSVGGRKVKQLIETGEQALKSFDFSAQYAEEYDKGNRDFELVYNYIKALNKSGKPSLKVANSYFRKQDNLTQEQTIKLLSVSASEADSKLFDRFIENKDAISKLITPKKTDKAIIKACAKTAAKSVEYESVELLDEAISKAEKHAPDAADDSKVNWVLDYFGYIEDAPAFISYVKDFPKDMSNDTRLRFGDVVLHLYGDDNKLLDEAKDQIKKCIKSDDANYMYPFMLAKIYIQKGDQKNAKKSAETALSLAKGLKNISQKINKIIDSI